MKREYLASIMVGAVIMIGMRASVAQESREENAARLIAQADQIKTKAAELHGRAQSDINNATKLKDAAQQLQVKLKVGSPQYKEAVSQFTADLSEFRGHTDAYNAHVADFEKTIGSCHSGEQQYQAHLEEYKLHMKMFHMPDVIPPHICGRLNMSEAQAAKVANTMRLDEQRVLSSEQALRTQENRLKATEEEAQLAMRKANNEALREEHEQQLAGEFGKLKQEYDLLKIERDAINGPVAIKSGASSAGSVHGQIKH